MKKIAAFVLVASVFLTALAHAQTGKNKEGIAKQILIDSLGLSEASADSVIAIRAQFMSEVKPIMKNDSLTQEQKKEKIKPMKQQMRIRIQKFLTDEQIEKLRKMEMERRQGNKDDDQ